MAKPRFNPARLLQILKPPEFIKVPFLLSYICLLTSYLAVLVFYFRLPPVVPLFYSLAQPAQQLAQKEWIFLFPILLTFLTVGHLSLINLFHDFERLLLQLFSWTTLTMNILVLAAIMRIIVIVS